MAWKKYTSSLKTNYRHQPGNIRLKMTYRFLTLKH